MWMALLGYETGAAMILDTASLDVRQMEEVDRLTVAAGTPADYASEWSANVA